MHVVDLAFAVESEGSRSKDCSFGVVKQRNIRAWHDVRVVHEHAETIASHVTEDWRKLIMLKEGDLEKCPWISQKEAMIVTWRALGFRWTVSPQRSTV